MKLENLLFTHFNKFKMKIKVNYTIFSKIPFFNAFTEFIILLNITMASSIT